MDTAVIVIIAVVLLLLLAVLAMKVLSPRKRAERRLHNERQHAAERHREEAEQRHSRAALAEQRAEEARVEAERVAAEAKLEREQATLHENRADLHDRGLADEDLPSGTRRDRDDTPDSELVADRDAEPIAQRSDADRNGHTSEAERANVNTADTTARDDTTAQPSEGRFSRDPERADHERFEEELATGRPGDTTSRPPTPRT